MDVLATSPQQPKAVSAVGRMRRGAVVVASSCLLLACVASGCNTASPGAGDDVGSGGSTSSGSDSGATVPRTPPSWASVNAGACPEKIVTSGLPGSRSRRCIPLGGPRLLGRAHGLDLNGDGRDALFTDMRTDPRLLHWDGTRLTRSELGFTTFVSSQYRCRLRYDFNADGILDVSCLNPGAGSPSVLANLGETLGEIVPQPNFNDVLLPWGDAVLVDPDQDGEPEWLIAGWFPVETRGFGLYDEVAGTIERKGPLYDLGGCGYPAGADYADFDEDGIDDVVVLDNPVACDSYLLDYDPEFHRVHVLLTRPKTESMDLVASVPTGAIGSSMFGLVYAGELTGDTHADIAIPLEPPGIISVAPGRGDGTFGPAVVYWAGDLGISDASRSVLFGQFDDDPFVEFVVIARTADAAWVLDDPRSGMGILERFAIDGSIAGVGDFDGDGVDDLVMKTRESFLLLSTLE